MVRIPLLIGLVIGGIAGLYAMALTLPGKDIFDTASPSQLMDPGPTAPSIAGHMKLRHARNRPAFDVGVFGNSRVLMLGAESMGFKTGRYFNFAIASDSFYGGVLAARTLAENGKLPRTLVFGLDNLNLQRDNNPSWPYIWHRIQWAGERIVDAVSDPGVSWAWLARRVWRSVWSEVIYFKQTFGPTMVKAGFLRLIGADAALEGSAENRNFRADGSVFNPGRDPNIGPMARPSARMDMILFLDELDRIGRFKEPGTRVFIFETPLYPEVQRQLETDPPAYVNEVRERWHEKCRALGFACIDAPLIEGDGADGRWYDVSHAPEKPWARFIKMHMVRAADAF
ncbi:MAG: hypothetical protein JJ855_17075 [Rhodospirillales bacterium]|nr:hypothetical protein [Rhodospirillales bacterium]